MTSNTPASDEDDIVLSGGCHCGLINYHSTTLPISLINCHCIDCRHMSGGPYITWASFPTSSIRWFSISTLDTGSLIPGDSTMGQYSANSWGIRGFCKDCGSTLRLLHKCDPERVSVAAGSITEQSLLGVSLQVTKHIFLHEKPRWEVLGEDGLERHQGFSDKALEKKIEVWREENPEMTTEELNRPENAWPKRYKKTAVARPWNV